uniref:DUF4371 domain-containing protein n=1 Tax=Pelodiscus sinensis TaxID=13735 RepID=K7G7R4_PELSI
IKYGFTVMEKNGIDHPQCVVCHTVLSNDALRPSRLERHLMKNHCALTEKPEEFFADKLQNLKCKKLDTTGAFHQVSAKVVEASYELSLLIAKAKKAHIIRETLMKPCLLKAIDMVLGVESKKKLLEIFLSDNSMKCHINELVKDLKIQIVEAVLASPFFAIQCDNTTDVAQYCQLLVYVQFINNETVKEELLFKKLMTTSKAFDIMKMISNFFEENRLSWENWMVCTDGAPAKLGSCSGFVTLVKEKKSSRNHNSVRHTQTSIGHYPDDPCDSLNLAIKVVNFVKNSALNMRLFDALCTDLGADHKSHLFHMEVRWLSKGNMLSRLFELKDEVEIFLKQQKKEELYHAFTDQMFQLSLAYLSLNNLNLNLQGNNAANIIAYYDAIKAFTEKIQLWKRQTKAQTPNFLSFPTFSSLTENEGFQEVCKEDVKNKIVFHLDCLADEFIRYFTDNVSGNPIHKLVHNPFNIDVDSLPEVFQEQALRIKYYSCEKDNFKNTSLEEFWIKYFPMYSKVGEKALPIIPFLSTYLGEKSFSSSVTLKTKQRNRLDVENYLRCTLSSFKPRISQIVKKMQQHLSH